MNNELDGVTKGVRDGNIVNVSATVRVVDGDPVNETPGVPDTPPVLDGITGEGVGV